MADPTVFLAACAAGDVTTIAAWLDASPALVAHADGQGRTGLHLAVSHPEAVGLLLSRGADPDARDLDDNVTPLHLAAAAGALSSVRLLLDAGADPIGQGDAHAGDVIGWAAGSRNAAVMALLVERGARHHVFSAMALRDQALVREVVTRDRHALERRRSRFENGHTPVHAAFAPPDGVGHLAGAADYDMLALLIELGADVDAPDARGRTPLDVALLRGDERAVQLLTAAGAHGSDDASRPPGTSTVPDALAAAAVALEPMITVTDMRASIDWYAALGFMLEHAHQDAGVLQFARLRHGNCGLALVPGVAAARGVSLWVLTPEVEAIYAQVAVRQRQAMAQRQRGIAAPLYPFDEDLYTPFYGGRQFSVRDPDGVSVVFYDPSR